MNERIKELMLKSNPDGDFSDCEWVFEKFAELIIKECVDIADEYDGAGSTIVSRIKKHFGVGEIENLKAGAEIHAGDKGYSIGTQEGYDEFMKKRNKR